jgi:hypothetical protein
VNRPNTPLDASELAATLNRHQVDYVVIGGVALQAHGHVRTTQDLDVVVAWTPANMDHLAAALRDLGAELRGVDADLLGIDLSSPEQLYGGGNFLLHTRHGDLDVFSVNDTPGAPQTYEQLREHAMAVDVRGIQLLIAHPEHLIPMKTAASQFRDRPEAKRRQDLDDIAVLNQALEAGGSQHGRTSPLRQRGVSRWPSQSPGGNGPTLER